MTLNKHLKYYTTIFIWAFTIPLIAQTDKKIDYSFFAYNGYVSKNYNYLMNPGSKWNDYISSIGGELSFLSGGFAKTQFETDLRYVTTFSNPATSSFTLRQLYIKIPLSDYLFLTAGKREENYGLADFYNFSNRLSPKERTLGHMDVLERQAPGLIKLDWVTSPVISLSAFTWSSDSLNWKYSNIGSSIELQINNFYSGVYFYYEKLRYWLAGFDISQQMNSLRFYSEGIIKEHDEQYYTQLLNFKNKGIQLDFSTGLNYEWEYYSASLEYTLRTEGFDNSEKNKIEDFIKNTGNFLGYNQSYFGKNYLGIDFGASRLWSPNLSLDIANLFTLDSFGGQLEANLSYLFNDEVVFGGDVVYNYGDKNSEYILFQPARLQIIGSVSINF